MEVVRRALLLGRQSCACAVVQLCGIGIFVRVWMQTDRLVTAYMNMIFKIGGGGGGIRRRSCALRSLSSLMCSSSETTL